MKVPGVQDGIESFLPLTSCVGHPRHTSDIQRRLGPLVYRPYDTFHHTVCLKMQLA